MKAYVRVLAAAMFSAGFLLGSGAVFADAPAPGSVRGGFTGPGPILVTVKQASSMRDDAPVTLRGFIVQSLGNEKYLFSDGTGTIRVEIDDKVWQGLQVTPKDKVEVQGEVDRDWKKVEVEVFSLKKVQ